MTALQREMIFVQLVLDSLNITSLALVNSKLADTRCIIDKDNKYA